MEILSAEQIRAWDAYTMQHEPIASIDLIERAAASCYSWLESHNYIGRSFSIYCGKGNNGGDGLALARMLSEADCSVAVHILEFGFLGTDDFQINLARLHQTAAEVRFIQGVDNFHPVTPGDILVDALLGSGLNRSLEGVAAALVDHLNASGNELIAVDIPSGLFVSRSSRGSTVIHAAHTLSFQCYKPAFLMPENGPIVGSVHILDIGLHPGFLEQISREAELLDEHIIRAIYKPRPAYAHKGNFGHALLVAGSYGKMGAAVLGARACLRSGAGLLTVHVPGCGYPILQTAIPEAMVLVDADERIHTAFEGELSGYSAVGVGPGIGTEGRTVEFLRDLLARSTKPVVLDADALNIIASSAGLWERVPPYSIVTPHPKEFERLFGPSGDDFARVEKAHNCFEGSLYVYRHAGRKGLF
jgi:ADP-dependent NAD(P)H-hydrate dehydratase / NAD(P)H-hydrate epimerase